MDVLQPFQEQIITVADNGSNVNCIGPKIAMKYKEFILNDRKEFPLHTGAGDVMCRAYLPIHIKNNSAIVKAKFYVLWDLPFDYLIGRPLIRTLGYHLIQPRVSTYFHEGTSNVLTKEDEE